jgi:hypothetical protein
MNIKFRNSQICVWWNVPRELPGPHWCSRADSQNRSCVTVALLRHIWPRIERKLNIAYFVMVESFGANYKGIIWREMLLTHILSENIKHVIH